MKDYNKKQHIEDTSNDTSHECMSDESRKLFKRALSEAMDLKIRKIEDKIKNTKTPPPSKRHKIRMNRLFRERVNGSALPFPEVDNLCERVRSKLILRLGINEILDRREERKRER